MGASMPSWDDARFFLAIERHGSLSAAARELRVNQSTVGRRLTALERSLRVRLFDRTPDGFSLTAGGERFLSRAERIAAEFDGLFLEMGGEESELTGTIRVTAPDGFGAKVVAPSLAEFQRTFS